MSPRLRSLLTVLALLVLWRSALFAVDLVGTSTTEERPFNQNADYRAFPRNYFLDGWVRWDAGWYRRIAERGYAREGRESSVVFFPAFPYAARVVGWLFGSHWIGGLVVGHLCLVLGLYAVHRLAWMLLDERRALLSVVFLLSFPGSFFFSAYLTESMFLAASATAMLAYLRRRFWVAGVCGLWATLTRPTGVALFAAIAADYGVALLRRRERLAPGALALLLMPCGVLLFMGILWLQVGDPLAFLEHQRIGWGRSTTFPLTPIWQTFAATDYGFPRSAAGFNTVFFVEAVVSTVFLVVPFLMIGRLPLAMWAFSLLAVVLPLSSGSVTSMIRYASVVFPFALWLAQVTASRPLAQWFLIYLFAMLLSLFNVRFMNWYWIG